MLACCGWEFLAVFALVAILASGARAATPEVIYSLAGDEDGEYRH